MLHGDDDNDDDCYPWPGVILSSTCLLHPRAAEVVWRDAVTPFLEGPLEQTQGVPPTLTLIPSPKSDYGQRMRKD